jgi:uncharacterized membrane-anchored protein
MSKLNLKVPPEFHRGLKAYALLKGKSMSEIVIDTLTKKIIEYSKSDSNVPLSKKILNDKTIKIFEETDKGINLTRYSSFDAMIAEIKTIATEVQKGNKE